MESLLLTSLGALLGLGVAWGALRVTNYYLVRMLPQSCRRRSTGACSDSPSR